jgi:hypothetical protein
MNQLLEWCDKTGRPLHDYVYENEDADIKVDSSLDCSLSASNFGIVGPLKPRPQSLLLFLLFLCLMPKSR